MKLSTRTEEDLRVISVQEERIDAAVAIEFKDAMRQNTLGGPDRVVLDLGQVRFIDSSGLGAIVASMKLLGDARKLSLAALTPPVEKVFRLTRMDSVFALYETVDHAVLDLAN